MRGEGREVFEQEVVLLLPSSAEVPPCGRKGHLICPTSLVL